jgi:hypothetical protein
MQFINVYFILVLIVTPAANNSPTPSLPIEQLLRSIAGTTEGKVCINAIKFYLLHSS